MYDPDVKGRTALRSFEIVARQQSAVATRRSRLARRLLG
jgi:hypothetical protein